jgi:hypothetical protein
MLAFYLPQFHPVPENDAWWGTGFTEWTNVVRARPLFEGHYQPHLPGELGFYDLRLPEVREQQASLAREHGIDGFCYYHYWFGAGRRVLERPFTEVLRSGSPDFPFCLAWANENWTREWDAGDKAVLMPQQYSDEDDEAHGRYLMEAFRDSRYIKIDGRPLFLIYRVQKLPDAKKTLARWREMARANGFPDMYIVKFETHGDFRDPAAFGCDASAEFLPHGVFEVLPPSQPPGCNPGNAIFSYEDIARHFAAREPVQWVRHPCILPGWDNSPRQPDGQVVAITGASVETYEWWLRRTLERAEQENPDQPIVFLNAWNEWAEGAHLEPDERHGRAYLKATRGALAWHGYAPRPAPPSDLVAPSAPEERYRDVYDKYVMLQREHTKFLQTMERRVAQAVEPLERELAQARQDAARLAALVAGLRQAPPTRSARDGLRKRLARASSSANQTGSEDDRQSQPD